MNLGAPASLPAHRRLLPVPARMPALPDLRFRGSMREIFRGILSPKERERSSVRRFRASRLAVFARSFSQMKD